MLAEPIPAELRQKWLKDHEWIFSIEGDKLVMNANEKGNHFHNDIPLDQIDPYESEEKFFLLRWPANLMRFGTAAALVAVYLCIVLSLWLGRLEWISLAIALASALAATSGLWVHLKHHRRLLRFYHRMTGAEVCALFTDLPDAEAAGAFLDRLKKEIPPWSYTFGGPSKAESLARELKALHRLRKDSVLTAEEFQFKKNELLVNYFHHGRGPKT